MFKFVKKVLNNPIKEKSNKEEKTDNQKLASSLEDNIQRFRALFQEDPDVVFKEFTIGSGGMQAAVIYIDGLADTNLIDEGILKPLMYYTVLPEKMPGKPNAALIEKLNLSVGQIREEDHIEKLTTAVLYGMTVLLLNHSKMGLIISSPGWEKRSLTEAMSEKTIRGPRVAFIETLRVNTALIRRRIRDTRLKFKMYELGRRSKTEVALVYMEGIVKKEIVDEIDKRISNIDIDIVDDVATIEAFIEDSPYSPFPQMLPTERPDKVTANLLEGKIAILCDGTPFAMIAPTTLAMLYQSPEDYYERSIYGTGVRILRLMALFIATTFPSIYISLLSFHHQLIPARLVLTLAMGRILVPFPAFLEALIMEITVELLREASTRLPGPLGQTVGVVGGLVLGQAAVSAKLVSPAMVIVVALTAMATFSVPIYSASYPIRLLRFPFMLAAATFGVFGIIVAWSFLLIHLCELKSFGVPYFSPIAPLTLSDWKDTIFRFPIWAMKKRPTVPGTEDDVRVGKDREGHKIE